MSEPRIHAAIVCAARSCPRLPGTPFRADTLDAQLHAATRDFIARRVQLTGTGSGRAIVASSILNWFDSDFAVSGGVRAFIAAHATEPVRTLVAGTMPLRWDEYDWRLNLATP